MSSTSVSDMWSCWLFYNERFALSAEWLWESWLQIWITLSITLTLLFPTLCLEQKWTKSLINMCFSFLRYVVCIFMPTCLSAQSNSVSFSHYQCQQNTSTALYMVQIQAFKAAVVWQHAEWQLPLHTLHILTLNNLQSRAYFLKKINFQRWLAC